jgi:hypothetical protein
MILFEDTFPPEDENLQFWDHGHWLKAQQQFGLHHDMDRKYRRTVSQRPLELYARLTMI